MKVQLVRASLLLLVLASLGCSKTVPPPNLTPPGIVAWENMRYQGYMDSARDIATIPAVPVSVGKPIVTWHRSGITILHARSEGWKASILTSLDEALRNVPADQDRIRQALTAARLVLTYVLRKEPIDDASVIAAYEAAYASSLGRDDSWLAAHP